MLQLTLTKKEQKVLAAAIFLLLTGLAVKMCRTASAPERIVSSQPAEQFDTVRSHASD